MKPTLRTVLWLLLALAGLPWPLQAKEMVSYARVMEDGSLKMKGYTIWLYGIYIPATERTCRTFQIPIQCGPRATLALEFKIEPHFVSCDEVEANEDGSIIAYCTVKGEDLSAWMLQQGWAVARPDAPFEYQTMEKIARVQGRGVWGVIIDRRLEGRERERGGEREHEGGKKGHRGHR